MRLTATLALGILLACAARADDGKLTVGGKYEMYFLLDDVKGKAVGDERMSWGQLNIGYGPHWSVTATNWWCPYLDFSTLDETYLQYQDDKFRFAFGRIRPPFGLDSWSDQWYYGFHFLPMVQGSPMFGEYGLALTQIGADTEYTNGNVELHLAATDTEQSWDQLKPTNLSQVWARIQVTKGDWIVGLDQTFDSRDTAHGFQRRAVDFRWSKPHLQLRGEVQQATDDQDHAWGYYGEAYYRPDWLDQITVFGRSETLEQESRKKTLYTLGAKKRIGEGLSASINYVFGPSSAVTAKGAGLSFQLLYGFSF